MICMGCKYYDAEHTICRNKKARYVGCDECFKYEKKKPTNGDRIRQMSDEELAKKMSGLESFALTCGGGWAPEKWLEWLRKESEVEK